MGRTLTVWELIDLFLENGYQEVEIFDIAENGKVIFKGTIGDMPIDIQDLTVQSIDNLTKKSDVLTINVDTEF